MGHGLDPDGLTPLMDMVLGFLYLSLPTPPVSTSSSLSAADDVTGDDRISLLPDDLLRAVVSRLPAKDGARTALLSSRWRRIWLSAPLVLVDAHLLPPAAGGGESGRRRPPRAGAASRAVADAVTRVLDSHPGPFPFVSLTCCFIDNDADHLAVAARWLDRLAAAGVEELVLVNRPYPIPGVRLPAELFRCGSSLRRLYIGAWELPDTAAIAVAAEFPNLKDLVLGCVVMMDPHGRDIPLLLAASPVLETLSVFGILNTLRVRLSSSSLRCAQFCLSLTEEVAVVDAPRLERLFLWSNLRDTRVRIGHAPQLRMLGYLQPGVHVLEIGNTIIKERTKVNPRTIVPAVNMLALHLRFGVWNEVKMLPSFLRCFPNVETLCVESSEGPESTNKIGVKFWQKDGLIECVQSHLKMIVFREFQGEQSEVSFLKYIAENARVLEKMVIVMKIGRYSAPMELVAKMRGLESAKWASGGNKLGFLLSRLRSGGTAWGLKAGMDLSYDDPFMCL
uniref:F-box domain-containing protein n=1 Tax=Leersia perrieri TaxID=77586 RepID=A0A0D9VCW6_9ORYZ